MKLAALFALVIALSSAWPLAAQSALQLPIVFHVAESAAHRAEPNAFIARQLEDANAAFAPLGIRFFEAKREALGQAHAALVSRADRDVLLRNAAPGAVHCMVVAKLMDVDEPGRERRGVHWHRADERQPHIVIVSTLAGAYVLAHELGHFFGNPQHSDLPGNLLSYLPGVTPPFLTPAQTTRVKRSVQRMLRSGELVPRP